QQVVPRVSVELGYSRRTWGNFTYTDNLAVGTADFDTYTFAVPSGPLATSGQQLTYALRNSRTAFGAVDNFLTLASNYGNVSYYWQGLEITATAPRGRSLAPRDR